MGRLPPLAEKTVATEGSAAGNRSASREGQYICAGFSGHGMTRAYSCAEGLARQLLGLPKGGDAPLPAAFGPDGRM